MALSHTSCSPPRLLAIAPISTTLTALAEPASSARGQGVQGQHPSALLFHIFQQAFGVGGAAGDNRHGVHLLGVDHHDAVFFQIGQVPGSFQLLKGQDNVRLALFDNGE